MPLSGNIDPSCEKSLRNRRYLRPVQRTSHKLLVVDDDPALARTLRRALAVEGYAVECANDGAEAHSTA